MSTVGYLNGVLLIEEEQRMGSASAHRIFDPTVALPWRVAATVSNSMPGGGFTGLDAFTTGCKSGRRVNSIATSRATRVQTKACSAQHRRKHSHTEQ